MSKLIIHPAQTRVARPARVRPPFNARPVCEAGRLDRSASGPFSTHYTATASYLYITRQAGEDRFGKVPDTYTDRGDLVATGRCHPQQKMPVEHRSGVGIWREADEAARLEGPRSIAATHIVADLPPSDDPARWTWLVERYAYRHLVELGMIVDWAIHARTGPEGGWSAPPHVHLLCTARFWRANARRGDRQRQWLASADQIRVAEDAWLTLIGLRPASAGTVRAA